jgi:aspartate racemase
LKYIAIMKTLGLIGGISWHSTVEYYRLINQQVSARLGGLHSASVLLHSVDFHEFQPPPDADGWTRLAVRFGDIAEALERGGAEALVLCANTAHLMADAVQRRLRIPLIHIADATAQAAGHLDTIGLLGTSFTMEQPFFKERLERAGIGVVIPGDDERDFIHHSIFSELTHGTFTDATRGRYLAIIDGLVAAGAQGIVLGCTEIPLLIKSAPVPLFDTTAIHAAAAVAFALG